MRLDHIAYRVHDRNAAAQFFINALGYKVQDSFKLDFGDGTFADCIALEPPGKCVRSTWQHIGDYGPPDFLAPIWHMAPELFVSDGEAGSIVAEWVKAHGPGVHHIAYQVDNVQRAMDEWKSKGYAEFATEAPLTCPGLTQVFTKPSAITGVIYEFITREGRGFCAANVKALMESTKGL